MSPLLAIVLTAAVWALALCLGLSRALGQRTNAWLVACFAASLLYVVLSLQLERIDAGPWLIGLKWALFTTTLFAFVRYRISRRRT